MPRTTRPLICGGIVYDNSAKTFYQPGVQLLYLGLSLLCVRTAYCTCTISSIPVCSVYSGTSLLQTSLGQWNVTWLGRCPRQIVYIYGTWLSVLIREVSFKRGSTVVAWMVFFRGFNLLSSVGILKMSFMRSSNTPVPGFSQWPTGERSQCVT